MCGSMMDIHSPTAENRRGKESKEENKTTVWADAQRDGHPAEYRWRFLAKFRNSIPCTALQSLTDIRC